MTIGIGMISANGIALASDTRTDSAVGTKRFDLPKINAIKMNKRPCAIIQAGRTELSCETVRQIQVAVEKSTPQTLDALRDVVHDSAQLVVRHVVETYPGHQLAGLDLNFQLIVACWDADGPHLLEVLPPYFFPQDRTKAGLICIGSGATLAEYVLEGYSASSAKKQDFHPVSYAALYAIEVVKAKDSSCEGETKLCVLERNRLVDIPQAGVNFTSQKCKEFEAKNRTEWVVKLGEWIISEHAKKQEIDRQSS